MSDPGGGMNDGGEVQYAQHQQYHHQEEYSVSTRDAALEARLASMYEQNEAWTSLRRQQGSGRKKHPLSTIARDLGAKRAARFDRHLAMISKVPLFEKMKKEQLHRAVGFLTPERAEADSLIMAQGTPGDSVYLMTSGECVVKHVRNGKEKVLATLTAPNHFGESGVLSGEKRDATIVAGPKGCALLRLSREAFQLLGDDVGDDVEDLNRARDIVTQQCQLFSCLRPAQQMQVVKRMKLVHFRSNEYLVEAGETGKNMYVVIDGLCSTVGRQVEQLSFGPGQYFGERALWRKVNGETVVAKTTTVCMGLHHDAFHPDLTHLLRLMVPGTVRKQNGDVANANKGGEEHDAALAGLLKRDWRQRLVILGRTLIRCLRETTYRLLYEDLASMTESERDEREAKKVVTVLTAKPVKEKKKKPTLDEEALSRIADSLGRLTPAQFLSHLGSHGAKVLNKLPYRRNALDMSLIRSLVTRHRSLRNLVRGRKQGTARRPSRDEPLTTMKKHALKKQPAASTTNKQWSEAQMSHLCRTLKFERVPALTMIFEHGGESPTKAYAILSGFVRVRRWYFPREVLERISREEAAGFNLSRRVPGPLDDDAVEMTALSLGPGDVFGCELFDDLRRAGAVFPDDETPSCSKTRQRLRQQQQQQQQQHEQQQEQQEVKAEHGDDDRPPVSSPSVPIPAMLPLSESRAPETRTAIAITSCECDLVVLEHADYNRALLMDEEEMTFEAKVQCLRAAALLKHWDTYRLHRLAWAMQERRYPKDKILAQEGTKAPCVACIVRGTAVLRLQPDSPQARVAAYTASVESRRDNNSGDDAGGLPAVFFGSFSALQQPATALQLFGRQPITLLTIGNGDYYGDSSGIQALTPDTKKKRTPGSLAVEMESTIVASAELVALELPPALECSLFDERDLRSLLENRRIRNTFRQRRLAILARAAVDRTTSNEPALSPLFETLALTIAPELAKAAASPMLSARADVPVEEEAGPDRGSRTAPGLRLETLDTSMLPRNKSADSLLRSVTSPKMISRTGIAHAIVEGGTQANSPTETDDDAVADDLGENRPSFSNLRPPYSASSPKRQQPRTLTPLTPATPASPAKQQLLLSKPLHNSVSAPTLSSIGHYQAIFANSKSGFEHHQPGFSTTINLPKHWFLSEQDR